MCHRASIYPQPPHILFPFSVFLLREEEEEESLHPLFLSSLWGRRRRRRRRRRQHHIGNFFFSLAAEVSRDFGPRCRFRLIFAYVFLAFHHKCPLFLCVKNGSRSPKRVVESLPPFAPLSRGLIDDCFLHHYLL